MEKGVILKNIFFLNLIILSLFNFSLNIEEIQQYELKDGDTLPINTQKEKHISFTLSDQLREEFKNSYIHFYANPQKADEINGIYFKYSSIKIDSTENYSYKFSKNANLILTMPQVNNFYLSILCIKYPCSYDLKVKLEKDYVDLNLDESNNYSNSYSYFVPGNANEKLSTMKFKIPSSLSRQYSKGKHLLTISVTNPSDKDAIVLKDSNQKELKENVYIAPMGKIFSLVEEEIGSNSANYYYLEIESLENQFISISIKASSYIEYDKIENDIIPNESPKYTFVNNTNDFKVKEECFTINEKYVNNYLKDENNDLLYASIEYFSLPIQYIVSNSNSFKSSNSSVNYILKRENNKYPQFCLKLNNKVENAYMVQISHVSKNNENIDIYNPISSGFIHMKTLNKNNLALYTYYSDIHFNNKLSFNLKVLKGKPEIYIYKCNTYPICNNDISKLRSDYQSVAISQLNNNQYYFYSFYNDITDKDLSPYGPKQKVLYVYCSEESSEDLCQFEILIYSNYDEIVLKESYKNFNTYLKKDETDFYKIHIPRGKTEIENIKITLNSNNENVKLESALENNQTAILNMINNREYEFKPVSGFNSKIKDFDIPFNVKASQDLSYSFDFSIGGENATDSGENDSKPEPPPRPSDDISNRQISLFNLNQVKKIDQIDSMPMLFAFNLSKTNGKFNTSDLHDLLFNFNFALKKINNNSKTSVFDEFEIKSKLIKSTSLNDFNGTLTEIKNNSNKIINGKFDLSTKSVILHFEKNYLLDEWNKIGSKDSGYIPCLLFYIYYAANKTKNIDIKNLSSKFFLIYKNSTSNDSVIEQNVYINDRIQIGSKKNLNFYHLSTGNAQHNHFVVDFSANYALSRGIYLTFLDYSKINSLKENEEINNSSNIDFKKVDDSYGKVYHFEFELKDKQKDVILCVFSKVKKSKKDNPLSNLNYIFKYYTTQASEKEKLYKGKNILFLKEVGQSNVDKKTKLSFSNITKNNSRPNFELYVRKVTKDNRLIREDLDTIGIIESKYELVDGDINFEKGITVTIPKIENKEDFYSIFINLPDYNEKLVYDTVNTPKPEQQLWLLILIFSGIPVLLGLIITIIIIAYNRTFDSLKDKIMNISFKESGGLGDRKDDDEDDEILK